MLHGLAQLEVERAERLVEEQRARVVDEGSGEGDALLLTAGQLRRLPTGEVREAHDLEELVDTLRDLGPRRPATARAERHVVEHAHVREQRVVLEDGVDVALVGRDPRDVRALEADPSRRGLLEPGDHPQRRRLAAPRRAEHREELAAADLEVRVLDRGEPTEALRHVVDVDDHVLGVLPLVQPGSPRQDGTLSTAVAGARAGNPS